jgi:hypothetical protein
VAHQGDEEEAVLPGEVRDRDVEGDRNRRFHVEDSNRAMTRR